MKIKQSLVLLSVLAAGLINSIHAMDESGNIEIYNPGQATFSIKLINTDTNKEILNQVLSSGSTAAEKLKLVFPNYELQVRDADGRMTKFIISDVTSKNNIIVDLYQSGNWVALKPYSKGILNPTSRRGTSAKNNIKEKNIKAIRPF